MSEHARKMSVRKWMRAHGIDFESFKMLKVFDCTFDVFIELRGGGHMERRLRVLPSPWMGGCAEV